MIYFSRGKNKKITKSGKLDKIWKLGVKEYDVYIQFLLESKDSMVSGCGFN
jgi:hypothetical protein